MRGSIFTSVFVAACAYGVTFPFLAAQLEAWNVSGGLIGLNAAMPALGWFLGSFLLPALQVRFAMRRILIAALVIACIAWSAFALLPGYWAWTVIRFVFGGSIGLFFRSVEFGLNATTANDRRGRVFGWYNFAFGMGIAVGAAIEPGLVDQPPLPWLMPAAMMLVAAVFAGVWRCEPGEAVERPCLKAWIETARLAPLPLAAAFAYGFGEDIPAYLLSIYALRNGFDADVAAFTLTAAALGSISIPLALGIFADRAGRRRALALGAFFSAVTAAAVPFSMASTGLFLALVVVTCGFAATLYTTALAMIGDRWPARGLNTANAAFGATYAAGGLIGPLVNGLAIDTLDSHGLMVSAALVPALLVTVIVVTGAPATGRRGGAADV